MSGSLRQTRDGSNFHWHVTGPHFRDYHLLLDEQATQILAMTDIIDERVRKRCGLSAMLRAANAFWIR
jgi:DNA-binding ferritin-like protein